MPNPLRILFLDLYLLFENRLSKCLRHVLGLLEDEVMIRFKSVCGSLNTLEFQPHPIGIFNIGIKHVFLCINIRQVPWEVLKHLPRVLVNVNALKNHVRSLLLHKN